MKIIVELSGYEMFLQDILPYMNGVCETSLIRAMIDDVDLIADGIRQLVNGEELDFNSSELLTYITKSAATMEVVLDSNTLVEIGQYCIDLLNPLLHAINRIVEFYDYRFKYQTHELGYYDDGSVCVYIEATKLREREFSEGVDLDELDRTVWDMSDKILKVICGAI